MSPALLLGVRLRNRFELFAAAIVAGLLALSPSPATAQVSPNAVACLSQGIRIKGEISGGEDLFIDGAVEGKVGGEAGAE